jgi:hypothetical protein
MRASRLVPALVLGLLACGSASMNAAHAPEGTASTLQGLRIELRAPGTVPYKVSVLGPGDVHVALHVTNVTAEARALEGLTVALTATREGVDFPCRVARSGEGREPRVLAAGASYTFERDLSCMLPIQGLYAVSVYAALGRAPTPGAEADRVGSFPLRIDATQDNAPREVPGFPGLFAVMSGNPFARPLPRGAWEPGAYRVVVAFVNGARQGYEALEARIVFRVYKVGEPIPCQESPVALRLPPRLEPGGVHLERVPVTCVIHAVGDYDVVGEVAVDHGTAPLELGRFRIHVTDEPTLDALPPP